MSKKLLIRFLVLVLILILGHSVFWFYKAGQLEKYVNNFISSNSANVSIASFEVSGFPLKQTIEINDLRFSIPNSALKKNKILVKKITATSKIFESDFVVELSGETMIFDKENKINNIDFNEKPTINLTINKGRISKFLYQDNGYRIFDQEKNLAYRASSSLINFVSEIDENQKITSKVNLEIKEAEGFGLVEIYKNSFEDKVIDGIKTGEIKLGSVIAQNFIGDQFSIAKDQEVVDNVDLRQGASIGEKDLKVNSPNQEVAKMIDAKVVNETEKLPDLTVKDAKNDVVIVAENIEVQNEIAEVENQEVYDELMAQQNQAENQVESAVKNEDSSFETNKNQEKLQEIDSLINEKTEEVAKNDIIMDLEYYLIPISQQNISLPMDPQKITAIEVEYNKSFKINNFQIINSDYKISVNGQIDQFKDDVKSSGFITVQVENYGNLVEFLKENIAKIANDNNSQLNSFDVASPEVSYNSYKNFLLKISSNIETIVPEIASKNQLSTGNVAVFEMRREKNLDFIVNETPLREILGKF